MTFQIAGLSFTNATGLPIDLDPFLVALSYLVAVFGSYLALEMAERWRNADSSQAGIWQLASATTLGGSIWSMHFIGMLALTIGLPMNISPAVAALSFVIAVAAAWCGLRMLTPSASWARICCGGVTVGIGISTMHYVGMAGMRFPGTLDYNFQLFVLSVLIGIAAATGALWLSLRLTKKGLRAAAALIMGSAICGMHYTGVAAAVFRGTQLVPNAPTHPLAGYPLGMAVALATLTLILIGLVIVGASRIVAAAALHEAEALRGANTTLAEVNADLALSRNRMDIVLNTIRQGVTFFDGSQRLLIWNRRFAEIYKHPPGMLRAGLTLGEVIESRYRVGTNTAMPLPDYLESELRIAAAGKEITRVETLADGQVVSLDRRPLRDGGWVSTHEDVTARKQAEDKIAFLALHDPLTGLANRRLFQERLEGAVAMAERGTGCAILCLDLDHFKFINDTLGHPVGDEVLQLVAQRLQACLREVDTLARLGGDEFAIVQVGVEQPDDASELAHRIISTLERPLEIGEHHIRCETSVGIALAPGDGASPTVLLKNADLALYLAKSEGRGTARFFEPEMDARIQLRRALERDLPDALNRNEFQLLFQPTVSLAGNRIEVFEALLWWRHPTRGLLDSTEFVPIAEENGMIMPIGDWLLRTACQEAVKWPSEIKVAINVSPAQFKKGALLAAVTSALAASGLQPERLEVEITESVVLHDTAEVIEVLTGLRAMDVTLVLDNFGTGYSSLSRLCKFPFGKIKIDQSFVRDLSQRSEARAVIRAIAALGETLSMATTVEGVEKGEQLDEVRKQGCTAVQGSLFGPPLPASKVLSLIEGIHPTREVGVQPQVSVEDSGFLSATKE